MCLRCEPLKLQPLTLLALDKKEPSPKSAWIKARKAETFYSARLRRIAHYIDDLVRMLWRPDEPWQSSFVLQDALTRYANTIEPWASAVAEKMITEVAARDAQAWRTVSARIGRGLQQEIENAPLGDIMRARLNEQVTLIKSIPLEAAERVHRETLRGITEGERAATLAEKIFAQGNVSESKALCIARTETSRTQTELVKARAEFVGSAEFIWRTAGDYDVRPRHKKLNGTVHRWDTPPHCDDGKGGAPIYALPGAVFNCRCYAEPVLADD